MLGTDIWLLVSGLAWLLVRGLITQLLRMPAVHTQACPLHTGLCTARPELSQSPGLQETISWIRVSHIVLYSQSLKIWAQNRTSSTLHSSYSQNPSSARRSLTCQHSTFIHGTQSTVVLGTPFWQPHRPPHPSSRLTALSPLYTQHSQVAVFPGV